MSSTHLIATEIGDTQQLWSEFSHRLRAFIASRVDSDADADDILQDVFIRIHRHAGTVQRGERIVSWLFQVTRNAIADYYRAPERRRELPSGASYDLDRERGHDHDLGGIHDAGDASPVAFRELATCVGPLVGQLAPIYRDAVTLVDLQGVSQQDAAVRAGLSVSGMKSRVQRGRQALGQLLDDCCHIDLDAGGRVTDFALRGSGCGPCACGCTGDG